MPPKDAHRGPDIRFDGTDLRANARAWRAAAGVPLRAVVKSDGYGWGIRAVVRALDDVVDGYYVADAGEFDEIRALTSRPIATLGDVGESSVADMIERDGIPTVSTPEGIARADAWARANGRRARIRVALCNATGWSGLSPAGLADVAPLLARSAVDVELSSHVTDPSLRVVQGDEFVAARAELRGAGVSLAGSDIASTAPLAAGAKLDCSHVRVGIGLFGVRFGADIGVVSALRVDAPIVMREASRGQRTGYGLERAPHHGHLAVLRCGYGDGFPVPVRYRTGILAVGMQFSTVHAREPFVGETVALVSRETDLDALAHASEIGPHRLVVGLGKGRLRTCDA